MKIIIKIRENHIPAVANHRLKLTAHLSKFLSARSLSVRRRSYKESVSSQECPVSSGMARHPSLLIG